MTITYDYDTLHRLNQITYPEQYPGTGRKVVTHDYDVVGRKTNLKVNSVDYASQINYNSESQITTFKVGTGSNQVTENYFYDIVSGLVTGQMATRGGTTLLSLSYDYHRGLCEDPNAACDGSPWVYYTTGQITRVENGLTGRAQHFDYDALGRLKTADQGRWVEEEWLWAYKTDWKQDYSYDRYGNRTGVTATNNSGVSPTPQDGLSSLTYEANSNRITTAGHTYDAAGNQLQNGTGQSFVYDAAGRLAKVKDQNGNTLETYTYGAARRRLITQHGNESSTSKTFYLWSGESVVAEYTEPNGGAAMPKWSKNYIYFGNGLLATEEPNGSGGELVRYYHPDRLGTRLITNNADNTSGQQSNLPFGTALDAALPGMTRRFTSYERSGTSLLDYAVNRNYDSRQGRFTQVDPIGMNAVNLLNPQSLNMYAYVGNDPVNSVDPLGTYGYTISFGGPGGGFPGVGGGSSGGLLGGLFNFGFGLLGSIFGGGSNQRHIIGSPFFSLPPASRILPLPGPTTTTISTTFIQGDRLTTLQNKIINLDKFLVSIKNSLVRNAKTSITVTLIQEALGQVFGNVFFQAGGLNPAEIEFAAEVSAYEGRSFQGRNAEGLDGFLHDGRVPTNNPRPIQLQENSRGGMSRMREDASEHERAMEKVPLSRMALYIKYTGTDLNLRSAMEFLWSDGTFGFRGMVNRGTIEEITIFIPDGVIRITRAGITSMERTNR